MLWNCYPDCDVGFSYGAGPHVIGFSKEGTIFSWGHNGFCQLGKFEFVPFTKCKVIPFICCIVLLGLGTSCQTQVPTIVSSGLLGKKVIDVSCGSHHSIVLTSEGEVYAFGQNNSGQIGCGSTGWI